MKKILAILPFLFFIACSNNEHKNIKKELETENIQIEQSDSNVQINDDTLPIPVDDEIKDENTTQGK
ncbi:hypothetical protein [Campylobacter peloridis]|uniref:Cytochrome C n=1 Tax=Campylobacter peloridis TaxID=488546 RepID=A0ABX6TTS1_9BACT|nr:hypothetical protein [Campylobacter peloridis]AJC85335.1 hypothetical protein CPEL_1526 [Campylobacter peloridis LMG 23910]MBX1885700.1 cytochrome C [Campylobacter peloridis]MBX2079010.1 cytochrome C [Campylobacter peloridis]QOQ89351.1 cytochrome C [Campylobacter peloridis]